MIFMYSTMCGGKEHSATCSELRMILQLHSEPIPNSIIYESFSKIKFFNFKSNFDQATQKKLKKLSYMAKLISMMPITMTSL